MHTLDFALTYEETGERLTAQFSRAALDIAGVQPGMRILDIAAGTGALSVPAAGQGAQVEAIDIAPGMVSRLAERLVPFPGSHAHHMDGQHLEFPDADFDVTFSIFGTFFFPDWRLGLREQARVTRQHGIGCLALWSDPRGGGPFVLLTEAMNTAFPDKVPPPPAETRVTLSSPDVITTEMTAAGFSDVSVQAVHASWVGPPASQYLSSIESLYRYKPDYAALSASERDHFRPILQHIAEQHVVDGVVSLPSTAWIATGRRP